MPGPAAQVHRLAVVVSVEQDRTARSGHLQLAVNVRRAVSLQEVRFDPAPRHHLEQRLSVPSHRRAIGCDVRQFQEFHQLVDDPCFVRSPVASHRVDRLRLAEAVAVDEQNEGATAQATCEQQPHESSCSSAA